MYTELTFGKFKNALINCLKQTIDVEENAMLDSHSGLTQHFKTVFMPYLAEQLSLELTDKEFLRFDYMLGVKGEKGYFVPIITVESENVGNNGSGDIDKEIRKLLVLNCPYKILLTRYQDVDADLRKEPEDTYWIYAIKDFTQFNQFNGYFIVASLVKVENNKYKYVVAIYSEQEPRQDFEILSGQ